MASFRPGILVSRGILVTSLTALSCGSSEGDSPSTGGSTSVSTGGVINTSTGGIASGGTATAAGGSPSTSGGTLATGGSSGGSSATGGNVTGGTLSGGALGSGGSSGSASGGMSSTGTGGSTPPSGGVAGSGGTNTSGGSASGGKASGGASTGGSKSTGGANSTGGSSTGGTSTGGAGGAAGGSKATGGSSTGGNMGTCTGNTTANLGLVGYATQNGGTTGGKGGTRVTVSTGAELAAALKAKQDSTTPLTIVVTGTITPENSGGVNKFDVKDIRDVSIIGAGSGAEFNGIGIKVVKAGNVILRNLKIHHVTIGDKDAISIEGPADHVWVDHCELYSQYQGVDKDFYDGLLDAKDESEYLTYSWNYFHDSWKTSLVGSSENDTFDRKITIHHNYFKNCNSRLPLFRGGSAHIFNNYYQDIGETAINSRSGACVQIENNYFMNTSNPWVSAFTTALGGGEIICNTLAGTTAFMYSDSDEIFALPACTLNVPYNHSAFLNLPAEVPRLVMENAGVGKLSNPESF
jgi:pectate lyase